MISVVQGAQVTVHFSLAFAGDKESIIDSTFEGEPAVLVVGDGNLPKGFESCLIGMQEGDDKEFTVSPENAFGQYNPNNVQIMEREAFKDMQLEKGLVVSFADAGKNELPGVIKAFDNTHVTVDFNHPLAGQALNFRARIVAISSPE